MESHMTSEQDYEYMNLAFRLSRLCKPEEDGRMHPYVGAVVIRPNGDQIKTAYRGQKVAGRHAEQEALLDQPSDVLEGAIVYTTLEPCTVRGPSWNSPWPNSSAAPGQLTRSLQLYCKAKKRRERLRFAALPTRHPRALRRSLRLRQSREFHAANRALWA